MCAYRYCASHEPLVNQGCKIIDSELNDRDNGCLSRQIKQQAILKFLRACLSVFVIGLKSNALRLNRMCDRVA